MKISIKKITKITTLLLIGALPTTQAEDFSLRKTLPTQPIQANPVVAPISPVDNKALSPQPLQAMESLAKPSINAQRMTPAANLPAPVNNMSQSVGVTSLPKAPVSFGSIAEPLPLQDIAESVNKAKCNNKPCVLTVNGAPLSQTTFISAKAGHPANRYKIEGWGFNKYKSAIGISVSLDGYDFPAIAYSNTMIQFDMKSGVTSPPSGSYDFNFFVIDYSRKIKADGKVKFVSQQQAISTNIKTPNLSGASVSLEPNPELVAANERACQSKRCILTVNGMPLGQTTFVAGDQSKTIYKVGGWGLGGQILAAKINVNNAENIDLKVIRNSIAEVVLEMPSDVKAPNGSAKLMIIVSGNGYAVYGQELAKFENNKSTVNSMLMRDTNVEIKSPATKSLSACKNCIENVNGKLSNIVYEVGGADLVIKGDGFGDKVGKINLHLNGQNKVISLNVNAASWRNNEITASIPFDTSGLLDDNNAALELTTSNGNSVAASAMIKPGKFIAARENITLTTLDIPRKIQQEGVAPTNMQDSFYRQKLDCDYGDTNCELLKHGFTDTFTVDTKTGFEILKDQTKVTFNYKSDYLTFSSESDVHNKDWDTYWYPMNKPFGQVGNFEWKGHTLYVNRYMKQYRAKRTLGSGGSSYFVSAAKVEVTVRGPRGVSPLHISTPVSKKN